MWWFMCGPKNHKFVTVTKKKIYGEFFFNLGQRGISEKQLKALASQGISEPLLFFRIMFQLRSRAQIQAGPPKRVSAGQTNRGAGGRRLAYSRLPT